MTTTRGGTPGLLDARPDRLWLRLANAELGLCRALNRPCRLRGIRGLFALTSRLGDGLFWYTLMLALPVVYGIEAVETSLHMLAVSAAGLATYRLIKAGTARPRPCNAGPGIELGARPLDRYSFPSGHTLHAVSFTVVATAHHPELILLLAPFSVLVALSRVALGLHYPTDVVSGAALGYGLAVTSLLLL